MSLFNHHQPTSVTYISLSSQSCTYIIMYIFIYYCMCSSTYCIFMLCVCVYVCVWRKLIIWKDFSLIRVPQLLPVMLLRCTHAIALAMNSHPGVRRPFQTCSSQFNIVSKTLAFPSHVIVLLQLHNLDWQQKLSMTVYSHNSVENYNHNAIAFATQWIPITMAFKLGLFLATNMVYIQELAIPN